MARLSGHRLGAILCIPAVVIGYTSGMKNALLRHLGNKANGMPALHKGYAEDSTVPNWVRHRLTSERHD